MFFVQIQELVLLNERLGETNVTMIFKIFMIWRDKRKEENGEDNIEELKNKEDDPESQAASPHLRIIILIFWTITITLLFLIFFVVKNNFFSYRAAAASLENQFFQHLKFSNQAQRIMVEAQTNVPLLFVFLNCGLEDEKAEWLCKSKFSLYLNFSNKSITFDDISFYLCQV